MILVGRGVLSWPGGERGSDRYGVIVTMSDNAEPILAPGAAECEGTRGHLVALVESTKESQHIGDVFRGIFPTTPNVGDEVVLGASGVLRIVNAWGEATPGGLSIEPDDGRVDDWFDPAALYRCHDQTVSLWFIPEA